MKIKVVKKAVVMALVVGSVGFGSVVMAVGAEQATKQVTPNASIHESSAEAAEETTGVRHISKHGDMQSFLDNYNRWSSLLSAENDSNSSFSASSAVKK